MTGESGCGEMTRIMPEIFFRWRRRIGGGSRIIVVSGGQWPRFWEEAACHYSEIELAALLISIANINAWNRLMAASRQIGGAWVESVIQRSRQPA